MRIKFLPLALAALALTVSCARRVETGYDSIDLVDRLVADSLPSLTERASLTGKPSGAIVLVGDPMRCLAVSESLMVSDDFDNVDARAVQDGLPDFSGETIISLLDFALAPYDSLPSAGQDSVRIREAAVKNALAALDSSLNCKVLVICSPALSGKGAEDVADLFGKIGCEVPVVSSQDTTFSYSSACFKLMRDRNMFTHDIAYPVSRLMMILEDGRRPTLYDDNLVQEWFADTLSVFARKTYISHVQNKYNSGGNR